MESELLKVAGEAYKTGGLGYVALLLGVWGSYWFLKNLLAKIQSLIDEQNDMSSLLLAQLLGKQMGSEDVAQAILERVKQSLEARRRK